MDEEGEEPFVALDSLLEVNLVEDATVCGTTHIGGDSLKNCGQESNRPAEDVTNSYAKNTLRLDGMPYSDLDAVQTAWGMDLEEDMFYKDLFKDVSTVQYLRLHCTVCDTHLGCKQGSVLMRHVRLGTLLCKDCFKFYGTGQFPIAEDGSESFCYWCGQGGNVICCSSCSAVFCKKCIRLNYTKSTIKEIESSSEWLCFVCNYRSLWEHRAVCRAAITYESSGPGPPKGDEAEGETPGLNQEFCCGSGLERRIPRLKSSMPSEVTFGEYIKSGRVKTSVMKMLKNVPVTGNVIDSISLDSDEAPKNGKIISADTQNKTLTHKTASKEMADSGQSVTASNTNKARECVSVASHNISYVDIGPLISQARFPSIHSQPTTRPQFFNQGIRSNIISNSQAIPSGRVVVMPPVHIPQRTVLRLPPANAAVIHQQNSSIEALSLGALLSSSPPVGSVQQQPNPMFRFQNGPSPFVVVSENSRMSGVPIVVRNSSGAYVPMYVNNSDNLHYIPKEPSQISGVPPFVQNQGNSAIISHPTQTKEKSENSITLPYSNTSNSVATYQPSVNGHTSQNMAETPVVHTVKSNLNSIVKSKRKSGYIQVRSPTALQSVKVSDIEHSPLAVGESVPCAVTEQQSIPNSLITGCPSGTVPSTLAPLAKEQSLHSSLLTERALKKFPQNKSATSLTSSTANLEETSVLKNLLNDTCQFSSTSQSISDTVADSSSPHTNDFSRKDIPQAQVVNQTMSSRNTDVIETKWFKENLLEAENVAKYMLTRITCVQEELDSESQQKKAFGDMVNHFSKLLEIASKKLADVNSSFTANFQRWKALSPSCHAGSSHGSGANLDKRSSVESKNGHSNSTADNSSCEEVEIISVKVGNKKRDAESSNSGSLDCPQLTCTAGLGSAVTLDEASSVTYTNSSEAVGQVAKPKAIAYKPTRMTTRRSNGCRTNTKTILKCCISSCTSDHQFQNKRERFQQNNKSSRRKAKNSIEQEKEDIYIPEKRRKLKEVRIILERIPNPGKMVFKGELNDSNVADHSTSDNNADSLEVMAVLKDESYLGADALVKQMKPCSVVIPRLSYKDINHCI